MERRQTAHGGFTLVELVIVIAIIGIISALAVQKLSGLDADARAKVNLANLKRVNAAVEAYVAQNTAANTRRSSAFDRLDALTLWDAPDGAKGSAANLQGVRDALLVYTNQAANVGLAASLASAAAASAYSASGAASVLGVYHLSDADAEALRAFGLVYVLRGYPERTAAPGSAYAAYGADRVYAATNAAESPDTCSCLAMTNYGGMAVAAVNPAGTVGRSPVGADIYRSLGQDVAFSGDTYKVMVDGVDANDGQDAFERLLAGAGVLLAFGIGPQCALVGNASAGLDEAPVSPVMKTDEYRRYIVLLRLRHAGTGASHSSSVEYAGVMDPNGQTIPMLRAAR